MALARPFAVFLAVACGAAPLVARDARADLKVAEAPPPPPDPEPPDDHWGLIAVGVVGSAVADIAFSLHDGIVAGRRELQSKGWSIAETAVTTPQALALDGLMGWYASHTERHSGDFTFEGLGVGLSVWTNALAVHGIWGAASDTVDPVALFGVSTVVGADSAFTAIALGSAFQGRLPHRGIGIVQMALTAPTIVVSAYESATSASNHGEWIALTAWSGALFAHGFAAAAFGGVPEWPRDSVKAAALRVVPTPMGSARAPGFGLSTSGVF